MTVLERKAKFITAILNDPDERRFAEIEGFYEKLSKPSFLCSVEELNDSLCKQEHDFAAGKIKGIPHEQILDKRAEDEEDLYLFNKYAKNDPDCWKILEGKEKEEFEK